MRGERNLGADELLDRAISLNKSLTIFLFYFFHMTIFIF